MENTNINSPEFWETVKREYQSSHASLPYICRKSKTFELEMGNIDTGTIIRDNVVEFLLVAGDSANSLFAHFRFHESFFTPNKAGVSLLEKESIRLDFLDYMIQKTRNNLQSPN